MTQKETSAARSLTDLFCNPRYIADIRHEAPAAFEAAGKTFIWTSSTTGFRANSAKLLVSESGPAGPFTVCPNRTPKT